MTYVRYELIRTFRNRRFFLLSLGFPLILYFVIAGPNRNEHSFGGSGIGAPLYLMVGLAAFGAMNAVLAGGARISLDRQLGWTRQLRLTPLRPRAYFATKLAVSYLTATVTIVALYAAGISFGVSLGAGAWVKMSALLLVGLLPFAAIGITLGHLLSTDALGPAIGGTTALLSLLGGVWTPVGSGVLHDVAEALPSFWLVQASHVSVGGSGWSPLGWLVMAAWTVAFSLLAARAYRRDTKRA